MSQSKQPTNYGALSTLVTVFFFWGFIAAGNSVFIPFCKNYFHLDQFQSQLIDFAFYLAYYIGALFLFAYGIFGGQDLVGKWGYKKSIIYGLLFSALGAGAMILAVNGNTFTGMLLGLFIVALGFSLQQTGAQPFAISLGDPSTGDTRVNLGGGVNSLGTTIGPLVVALALFGSASSVCDYEIQSLPLSKVIGLYIFVGILFVAAATLFGTSKKVPAGIHPDKPEKAGRAFSAMLLITGLLIITFIPVFSSYRSAGVQQIAQIESTIKEQKGQIDQLECEALKQTGAARNEVYAKIEDIKKTFSKQNEEIAAIKGPLERQRLTWLLLALAVIVIGLPLCNQIASKQKEGWGAMQYPQLVLGMLGIFVYVGVEVAIGSNLGELLKQPEFGGYKSSEIAPFIAMYWGSLMIGRWAGAVGAFNLSEDRKKLFTFLTPLVAFGVVLLLTKLAGHDIQILYWYVVCVLLQIGTFFLSRNNPARTLLLFSLFGVAAMAVGIMTTGKIAIYAFLSGGLACSIMWPSIFALSVAGLGKYTTQGSAFLIMMILGGAVIPPVQGKLADIIGIHQSFFVAILCFAYLALFAYLVKGILQKQGIDYETASTGGGH